MKKVVAMIANGLCRPNSPTYRRILHRLREEEENPLGTPDPERQAGGKWPKKSESLTKEERAEIRRQKNIQSAKRSNKKMRAKLAELEEIKWLLAEFKKQHSSLEAQSTTGIVKMLVAGFKS